MKKRKPKSLYEARILGSFILVFILGLVIKNSVPASYPLLIIGPIAVVWFMKYDDAKYLVYTKRDSLVHKRLSPIQKLYMRIITQNLEEMKWIMCQIN